MTGLLEKEAEEIYYCIEQVDRLFRWETCCNAPIMKALKKQRRDVRKEFNMRLLRCTVLEVKVIEGHGTTLDVVDNDILTAFPILFLLQGFHYLTGYQCFNVYILPGMIKGTNPNKQQKIYGRHFGLDDEHCQSHFKEVN
ncbi:hypothetical protein Pint_19548 [Pistacia integerrima]|uniref:Uncharacterized protein n=1 Tax=Pistacia integerrima TaxID=434235 RepID=A0ACC0XEG5_9ROSI|nr:hypothetical protein Pint_19548 [Pistacia integerrima]